MIRRIRRLLREVDPVSEDPSGPSPRGYPRRSGGVVAVVVEQVQSCWRRVRVRLWDTAELTEEHGRCREETVVVEPGDLFQGGEFEVLEAAPDARRSV